MPVVGTHPHPELIREQLSRVPRPWVADIGSGCEPWPLANILVDKFPGATHHRPESLRTDGKLFIQADIGALPFEDRSLDFVIASHVLEHTEDPLIALAELQRVSSKGVAWVPSILAQVHAHLVRGGGVVGAGHKWLAAKDRERGICFIPFDDNDPELVSRLLNDCGPAAEYAVLGYVAEIRIAWGWGTYPARVPVYVAEGWKCEAAPCQS